LTTKYTAQIDLKGLREIVAATDLAMSVMSLDQEWAAFLENGSSAIVKPQLVRCQPDTDEAKITPWKEECMRAPEEVVAPEVASGIANNGAIERSNDGPPPISGNIEEVPPLIISTKSNNAKLNGQSGDMDVWSMFWALEVIPYITRGEGVIKKQIKVQCKSRRELDELNERLQAIPSHSITKEQGTNTDEHDKVCFAPGCRSTPDSASPSCYSTVCRRRANLPFNYIAKLCVGVSSKDIKAHRVKEKNAFFNSFTMVLRVRYQSSFKEIVIKVFNKNVLSLPGMLDDELLTNSLALIDRVLGDASLIVHPERPRLAHIPGSISDVMVNSNFWCGFGLDRDKVVTLMREQCKLETSYDPSNYPGVICRFYEARGDKAGTAPPGVCPCAKSCSTIRIGDKRKATKNKDSESPDACVKLTFMLFRTGSVLIVGRCDRVLLQKVHNHIARLLLSNRALIENGPGEKPTTKRTEKKQRKRTIYSY
jgi:hypothetical protein